MNVPYMQGVNFLNLLSLRLILARTKFALIDCCSAFELTDCSPTHIH